MSLARQSSGYIGATLDDVHFLAAPGDAEESPTERAAREASDSDGGDEEGAEWLALELSQHLPQDKLEKLLRSMNRKEKQMQDLRRDRETLRHACEQLGQERSELTRRLSDSSSPSARASRNAPQSPRCEDTQAAEPADPPKETDEDTQEPEAPTETEASGASARAPPDPAASSEPLSEEVPDAPGEPAEAEPPTETEAIGAPARPPPEPAASSEAQAPDAPGEFTEAAAGVCEAPTEVVLKIHTPVRGGAETRRLHVPSVAFDAVQEAVRQFYLSKGGKDGSRPRAVVLVGAAEGTKFEVRPLSCESWTEALSASMIGCTSSVPTVRLRMDLRNIKS